MKSRKLNVQKLSLISVKAGIFAYSWVPRQQMAMINDRYKRIFVEDFL